jgi:hypothetical protein
VVEQQDTDMTRIANELLNARLKEVYKEIEMTRTHAENFKQQAKDYRDKVVALEETKLSLISGLEKLGKE